MAKKRKIYLDDMTEKELFIASKKEDFSCCGGNDEHIQFHTSDCDDHPWNTDEKKCSHYFLKNIFMMNCEHCRKLI